MGGNHRFPSNDAEFGSYIVQCDNYISNQQPRLNTQHDDLLQLNQLHVQWMNIFPLYANLDSRTTAITQQKNALRNQLEILLRKIFDDIPKSQLTIDDRNILNLPERDHTPTHAPIPDRAPVLAVDEIGHLFHTIRFADPANPHTQAKPEGVASVELWYAVGVAPVVPAFALYGSTGRFLYRINFAETDVSKTASYKARYVNTRGEKGPWSAVISAVVA